MLEEKSPIPNWQIKCLERIAEENATRIFYFQRRPYTCCVVLTEINGCEYFDCGFSKVNWPDWFLPWRGRQIALGRALENIAERAAGVQDTPYHDYLATDELSTMMDELNPLLLGA